MQSRAIFWGFVLRVAYFIHDNTLSLREKSRQKCSQKNGLIQHFFKENRNFYKFTFQKEGHVLEHPKDGTFLPKKDIWSL
jgi:hypothetical protein